MNQGQMFSTRTVTHQQKLRLHYRFYPFIASSGLETHYTVPVIIVVNNRETHL